MEWQIETDGDTVSLSDFQLMNLLSAKVVEKEREDHRILGDMLVKRLESNEILSTITLTQLSTMAFELGYFYRIFREKNKVTIDTGEENQVEPTTNESSS